MSVLPKSGSVTGNSVGHYDPSYFGQSQLSEYINDVSIFNFMLSSSESSLVTKIQHPGSSSSSQTIKVIDWFLWWTELISKEHWTLLRLCYQLMLNTSAQGTNVMEAGTKPRLCNCAAQHLPLLGPSPELQIWCRKGILDSKCISALLFAKLHEKPSECIRGKEPETQYIPMALKVVDFDFTSDFSWNNE